jgi:hypothetical protein
LLGKCFYSLVAHFDEKRRLEVVKAVVGDMSVSTGGVLRLGKSIQDLFGIKAGDRIILLQDTENSKMTLQLQRGSKVIMLLDGAELIKA